MIRTIWMLLILFGSVLIISAPAGADRIPILAPITITQAGSYYLSNSFTSPGTAIDIKVANVSVDLDGQRIICTDLTLPCIKSTEPNTTVLNGTIVGGYEGIYLRSSGDYRVEKVVLIVSAGIGIRVEATDPSNPVRPVIVHNSVRPAAKSSYGIFLSIARNAIVQDNSVSGGWVGIRGESTYSSVFDGNRVSNSISTGLVVDGGDNRISNNVMWQNGSGLSVTGDGNLIAGNIASSSASNSKFGGNGISVPSDNNVITENVCNGNMKWGIDISGSGNVYSGNRALSNGTGGYNVAGGNTDAGGNY